MDKFYKLLQVGDLFVVKKSSTLKLGPARVIMFDVAVDILAIFLGIKSSKLMGKAPFLYQWQGRNRYFKD